MVTVVLWGCGWEMLHLNSRPDFYRNGVPGGRGQVGTLQFWRAGIVSRMIRPVGIYMMISSSWISMTKR